HLDELYRTAKFDHADGDAPIYAADERLFQKGREPRCGRRASHDVLQLRSHSSNLEDDARRCGRCRRPRLDYRRDHWAVRFKMSHYRNSGVERGSRCSLKWLWLRKGGNQPRAAHTTSRLPRGPPSHVRIRTKELLCALL